MSTITTAQPAPQASVKITFSRKIIIRVLAVFIVAITAMIDFWLVALLAGSGQGYATTEIVFNLLDVAVSVAVGLVLWVLSND
jgi:hypothetical protein